MSEGKRQGVGPESSKRILVVEDHRDTAQLILAVLAEEGYLVEWVSTAADALQSLSSCASPLPEDQEKCPDVVLLDLSLSSPDALETIQQLLRPLASPPRVVLVSARSLKEIEAAAEAVGAAGVIRKPFSLDTLLNAIEEPGGTGQSRGSAQHTCLPPGCHKFGPSFVYSSLSGISTERRDTDEVQHSTSHKRPGCGGCRRGAGGTGRGNLPGQGRPQSHPL